MGKHLLLERVQQDRVTYLDHWRKGSLTIATLNG